MCKLNKLRVLLQPTHFASFDIKCLCRRYIFDPLSHTSMSRTERRLDDIVNDNVNDVPTQNCFDRYIEHMLACEDNIDTAFHLLMYYVLDRHNPIRLKKTVLLLLYIIQLNPEMDTFHVKRVHKDVDTISVSELVDRTIIELVNIREMLDKVIKISESSVSESVKQLSETLRSKSIVYRKEAEEAEKEELIRNMKNVPAPDLPRTLPPRLARKEEPVVDAEAQQEPAYDLVVFGDADTDATPKKNGYHSV